jgi:hypothetical protein
MPTPAVVYNHGPGSGADAAAEARRALKAGVAVNLSVATYRSLAWSKSQIPTIVDLQALRCEQGGGLGRLKAKSRRELLQDDSALTELEKGDGVLPGISRARGSGRFTTTELSSLYRAAVMPSQLEQSSRRGYFASWRTVVTWLLAHDAADQGLPMTKKLLDALTMELLLMGATVGSIRNIWSSVEDRHRTYGHTPPLGEPGAFRRGLKALSSLRGQPTKLLFPLGRRHVQALLRLAGLTWFQKRNVLLTLTGTVMCSRVSEPAGLRICNVFPDIDVPYDPTYAGGYGLKIVKRKNDTKRRGIMTRVPPGPLAERLRKWIAEERLVRHPQCTLESSPGARCRFCPPLFPKSPRPRSEDIGSRSRTAVTRQNVTSAVKSCVRMLDGDDQHFSGKSMRLGGLSMAINAKVPEPILFLQSGHGKAKAARGYMIPDDPSLLYDTGKAILEA